MQRGIYLSPFHRDFCSDSTFSSSLLCPHSYPTKAAWLLGSGEQTHLCCSCCEHKLQNPLLAWGTARQPAAPHSAMCPQLCHSCGMKQAADRAPAPAAHPKLPRLSSLASCTTVTKNTSPLLMDYQDPQGIQPSFEDGEFTFHPDGLLAFVSHLTVPLSLPIFPWLLSVPGGRSRL